MSTFNSPNIKITGPKRGPQAGNTEIFAALETYVIALDALMCAHVTRTAPSLGPDYNKVRCEVRQKYAKIIAGSSVYSYVDLATGDVLKGNWKGPERAVMHIKRGNVLDGSWLDWHGPYGIGYADAHGQFRRMLPDADYMVARDAIMCHDHEAAARILRDAIAARVDRDGSPSA